MWCLQFVHVLLLWEHKNPFTLAMTLLKKLARFKPTGFRKKCLLPTHFPALQWWQEYFFLAWTKRKKWIPVWSLGNSCLGVWREQGQRHQFWGLEDCPNHCVCSGSCCLLHLFELLLLWFLLKVLLHAWENGRNETRWQCCWVGPNVAWKCFAGKRFHNWVDWAALWLCDFKKWHCQLA